MYFQMLKRNEDVSILLLRLAVGAIFLVAGWMKLSNFASLPMLMQILAIAEPLGGIALILGFLARWASLGLTIIMVGAVYTHAVTWGNAFVESGKVGWNYPALLLACCIMLMTVGAGKYSVDAKAGW